MASFISPLGLARLTPYGEASPGEGQRDYMFLFATLAEATQYVNFNELMGQNSEVAFSVFGLPIRWYALAYLAGIFVGYWYLLKLIAQPGAPMARRHADDMIFYAMLGIIIGGRLGYVLFYNLGEYINEPLGVFRLWDGGMSLHGGVIGVLIAIWYVTRKEKLSFLRFCDYVACVVPFGLFFGRLANFVNGELWGRATTVPWAIIFFRQRHDGPAPPEPALRSGARGPADDGDPRLLLLAHRCPLQARFPVWHGGDHLWPQPLCRRVRARARCATWHAVVGADDGTDADRADAADR